MNQQPPQPGIVPENKVYRAIPPEPFHQLPVLISGLDFKLSGVISAAVQGATNLMSLEEVGPSDMRRLARRPLYMHEKLADRSFPRFTGIVVLQPHGDRSYRAVPFGAVDLGMYIQIQVVHWYERNGHLSNSPPNIVLRPLPGAFSLPQCIYILYVAEMELLKALRAEKTKETAQKDRAAIDSMEKQSVALFEARVLLFRFLERYPIPMGPIKEYLGTALDFNGKASADPADEVVESKQLSPGFQENNMVRAVRNMLDDFNSGDATAAEATSFLNWAESQHWYNNLPAALLAEIAALRNQLQAAQAALRRRRNALKKKKAAAVKKPKPKKPKARK